MMTVEIAGAEVKSVPRGDDGGRATAQIVKCGYCPEEMPVFSSRGGALPPTGVKRRAEANGWKWVGTGDHVCPKCLAKFKKEAARKKEPEMREMTPVDRRKIFRAIDDHYEEVNQRYAGDATDHSIAKELSVPRAWVTTIREEAFGPAGRNGEMDKVASAIGHLSAEAKKVSDRALLAAEQAEAVMKQCEEMRKRLDAIDAAVGPRSAG